MQERRAELRERLRLLHVDPIADDPARPAAALGPQRSRPGSSERTSDSDAEDPARARAAVRRGGKGGGEGRADREARKLREVERALEAPGSLVPPRPAPRAPPHASQVLRIVDQGTCSE